MQIETSHRIKEIGPLSEAERVTESSETTFPVRVAARMTGLTPELLRAWERRYAAVEPLRTEGGTRRYTADHLKRLQLLRQAVDAGHRISDVARMDEEALRACVAPASTHAESWIDDVIAALRQLDSERARTLFDERVESVGMAEFARKGALPLLYEIGERWQAGNLSVAAEHLATTLIRSMLASELFAHTPPEAGPTIVFATPSGEDHDLGLLIAGLTAAANGANVVFLGANMPESDLIDCVESSHADVLALGLVTLSPETAMPILTGLRKALPTRVALWLGGAGAQQCASIRGVDQVSNLDQLMAHVALLDVKSAAAAE